MPDSILCDIYCRVIDNYGDAGVAWRLANSLAAELGSIR
ncbi:MAG: elongation factor P maturation arginine rhamnosyltransferase EarP, partial [Duodenibacillus sp.]|nr:elongation factor P maturation arginine rhamnosyltransferase EarP [Duodenibacillus sp.]